MWDLLKGVSWQEVAGFLTVIGIVVGAAVLAFRKLNRWLCPDVSDAEFLRVRADQKRMRALLSRLAYQLPEYAHARGAEKLKIPLLCEPRWIADRPILLGDPGPNLRDQPPNLSIQYVEQARGGSWIRDARRFWKLARCKLPKQDDGRLCWAIRRLDPPQRLTSDPCYSLLAASKEGEAHTLRFGLADYSEYIDVGEALAYEFAREYTRARGPERQDPWQFVPSAAFCHALAMRHASGAWHEVERRPSLTGVNCLTLIEHETGPTFLMMDRVNVGSAQNTVHVIPAGEFQPTQALEVEASRQCRLWQTVLREFAEELLGMAEVENSQHPFDHLAREPAIVAMRKLITEKRLRAWFLGCGLDPLTLKPEVLVVLRIRRDDLLDLLNQATEAEFRPGDATHALKGLPAKNAEGLVFAGDTDWGYRLNPEELTRMANDSRTLPAGIGCLRLAALHLDSLLSDSSP